MENLRETVEKDTAILADPQASDVEKETAYFDRAISRRLIAKGIDELEES